MELNGGNIHIKYTRIVICLSHFDIYMLYFLNVISTKSKQKKSNFIELNSIPTDVRKEMQSEMVKWVINEFIVFFFHFIIFPFRIRWMEKVLLQLRCDVVIVIVYWKEIEKIWRWICRLLSFRLAFGMSCGAVAWKLSDDGSVFIKQLKADRPDISGNVVSFLNSLRSAPLMLKPYLV